MRARKQKQAIVTYNLNPWMLRLCLREPPEYDQKPHLITSGWGSKAWRDPWPTLPEEKEMIWKLLLAVLWRSSE